MIWLATIVLIGLIILLIAMIRDMKKHPEAYEVPKSTRRRRRRRSSKHTYTGLPWMGGKKVRKRY